MCWAILTPRPGTLGNPDVKFSGKTEDRDPSQVRIISGVRGSNQASTLRFTFSGSGRLAQQVSPPRRWQ